LHNNLKSPLSSGFFVGQYFCKSIEFQGFDQKLLQNCCAAIYADYRV